MKIFRYFIFLQAISLLIPVLEVRAQCVPVNNEYLVRVNSKKLPTAQGLRATHVANILADVGVSNVLRESKYVSGLYRVKIDSFSQSAVRAKRDSDEILYVEPNCKRELRNRRPRATTPNDPRYGEQYGLNNDGSNGITANIDINAPEAWDISTGSSDVVLAVVDSGVDFNHQDLAANMWVNSGEIANNNIDDDSNGYIDDVHGAYVIDNNGDVLDTTAPGEAHGTLIAGVISAAGNNSVGVTGVNWNAKIMAVKIFSDDGGGGSLADIIEGWEYIIDMKVRGINVRAVNNSFGTHGENPSQSEVDTVTAARSQNILFVFAAGNDGANNDTDLDTSNYSLDNVLSVAAVTSSGALASFSNFGTSFVHLAAPGDDILMPSPGNAYELNSGTSFAAPFVVGVAGLVAGRESSLTASQLRDRLIDTVTPLGSLTSTTMSGGMVNAYEALRRGDDTPICVPSAGSAPNRPTPDADGDGVIDSVESTDGTDANDAGSFKVHLSSPVFALWTGFLDIIPIAELVNPGEDAITARLSLLNISGQVQSSVLVNIFPGKQRDIIVRDMTGFLQNSYGLLRIDFCNGSLDGRVSYYRSSATGGYEFAFSDALSQPSYGPTAVGFNTFQPSLNASESQNEVANWLSIVNLASSSRTFTVQRFNQAGTSLGSSQVTLSGGGRLDVEAGHQSLGASVVGMLKVVPSNLNSPYIANLARYGGNAPPGVAATAFSFAFPLVVKAASGRTLGVPLTTTISSQNWLEVINTRSVPTSVTINFYLSNGTQVDTVTRSLPGNSQEHFHVNSRIGDSQVGFAEIIPGASNSILAQSMVYVHDSVTGSIQAMYGSQAREALGSSLSGSFNLYLNMLNWLKIINLGSQAKNVSVRVENASTTVTRTYSVAAKSSVDVGLHEMATFGTSPNTLGAIKVSASGSPKILSELLRLRPDGSGGVEYLFPTQVRDSQ